MNVPNAPCGVESIFFNLSKPSGAVVPNAPCGVESLSEDGVDWFVGD